MNWNFDKILAFEQLKYINWNLIKNFGIWENNLWNKLTLPYMVWQCFSGRKESLGSVKMSRTQLLTNWLKMVRTCSHLVSLYNIFREIETVFSYYAAKWRSMVIVLSLYISIAKLEMLKSICSRGRIYWMFQSEGKSIECQSIFVRPQKFAVFLRSYYGMMLSSLSASVDRLVSARWLLF